MIINVAAKMKRNARKLDRLNTKVQATLSAMRRGEALLLEYRWYGAAWCLSRGRHVDDEVARIIIQNKSVADVGDALQIDGADRKPGDGSATDKQKERL